MVAHRKRLGRRPGVSGAETFERIRSEGIRLLNERGYGEMSLRDLASKVGISPGSLYNHISSKQELLLVLLEKHMREALAVMNDRLNTLIRDPSKELEIFIETHLEFHAGRSDEAAICISELRSLKGQNRETILQLRDKYERLLEKILAEGRESGVFQIDDLRITTLAVLGMVTSTLTWYKPPGRLALKEISNSISQLLLSGLHS